jgi:hypothetical protein
MGDEEERRAPRPERPEMPEQDPGLPAAQRGGRLVQEERAGAGGEGLQDLDELPFPETERPDREPRASSFVGTVR